MNISTYNYRFVHLFKLFIFTFLLPFVAHKSNAQGIPFEVENHFEIHNDTDIGIRLMPEEFCEFSSSEDFGFVFKRNRFLVSTDFPEPPPGFCGDVYDDPSLEFYPADFNNFGFVISSLGTAANSWNNVFGEAFHVSRIIRGPGNSQYGNQIVLPAGAKILGENDGLVDDGIIYGPLSAGKDSDIGLWSQDDIILNFKANNAQTDGQFAISESTPTNIRFKVGTGGDIFMPALSATNAFYPSVVINPVDGQLYYQNPPGIINGPDSNQELRNQVQELQEVNQNLINSLNSLHDKIELLEANMKTSQFTN